MERDAGADARFCAIDPEGEAAPLGSASDFRPGLSVLALLTEETRPLLPVALKRHRRPYPSNALTLLVPPRASPELSARSDGAVVAFLASGPWAASVLEWEPCSPIELCYRALSCVLDPEHAPIDLTIVDKATEDDADPPREGINVDLMMPHRGDDDHLRAALASLGGQTFPGRIILCFDQSPPSALCRELMKQEGLDLFEVVPNPAGPYVPRQHFVMKSAARYIAFQDSDDFSLPSRLEALVAYAEAQQADLVGCHELRFDETKHIVEAVRYPLDVNEALRSASGHAQLFSTAVARVDTLRRIGGFSTIRTFGADKQFHLRAYWDARMLNMDSFLYVRRLRERSLTTSATTGMSSAVRQEVTRRWKEAFQDIKDGRIAAADSALRIEHSRDEFKIRNLRTGAVSPVMLQSDSVAADN
jgi:hypothetical protein